MVYIRVENNKVTLGGEVASDSMLADGWLEYNGVIPVIPEEEAEYSYMTLVDGVLSVAIDADKKASYDKKVRDEAMLKGFDYNGSQISVTAADGNGMLQVKAAFDMGLTETVIHFKNGTKLPMTSSDFPAFALQFVKERNKFFI